MKTRLEGQGEGRGGLTRRSLLWMGLGLVSGGCGYRSHPGGASPDEERRLFVAAITNETFRAGLQGLVGAAIRRQLQFEGGVRLVEERGAGRVLSGRVTGYVSDGIGFDRQDIGHRFRVRLILQATVTPADGKGAPWNGEFIGETFYTAGTGVVNTRTAEDEAVRRAAQDLAARLVARLLEEW